MSRFRMLVSMLAAVIFLLPACVAGDEVDNLDTGASLGSFFIESLTGKSPTALGIASDGAQVIRIGEAVAGGNYIEALSLTAEFAGNKMIAAVPILGQAKLLADTGRWFGNYMYKVMGNKNFGKMYHELSDYPVDTWPSSYEELSGGMYPVFEAHFQYLARDYASQVLRDAGYKEKITDPEAERIVFEAFLERAHFEQACDKAGLSGKKRTLENLKRTLENELSVEAEAAGKQAKSREEKLVQELAAAETAKESEAGDIEAEVAQEMAEIEQQQQQAIQVESAAQEATQAALPKPDDVIVVTPQKPAIPATEMQNETTDEKQKDEASLSWSVAAAAGDDQTVFTITVSNISPKTVKGFSCSADPVGEYESGGVGWGYSPSFDSIASGQSITFTALAMGDVKGLVLTFSTDGGVLGSEKVMSIHKRNIKADGSYKGSFAGNGISGTLTITISGRSVTGALKGNYSDPSQNVVNSASITGTFDPETGHISATWSGAATGTMTIDGEKHKVNEPISGTLGGTFSNGAFGGNWSGGSAYISSSGSWSAR